MNKKKLAVGLGILFILLVSLVAVSSYLFIGGGLPTTSGTPKYWYECNFVVDENLIGKGVSLQDVSCSSTGKKCGALFSIFSAEGTVELWDNGGKLASKDYSTGLFNGKDQITLQGCSDGSGLKLKLYDENHNLLETKNI